MKFRGVALLCGLLLVAAQAQADEVDDLLAGKPVVLTQDQETPVRPSELPALEEPLVQQAAAVESLPLAEETAWDIATGPQPHASLSDNSPAPRQKRESAPSVPVSMVPEPSAIALAVLALLYFLIFFRRRHLA